jgi:hypothetical protein
MSEENVQGNPKEVDDAVFGSEGDDFFTALENDVNSAIQDDAQESSTQVTSGNQSPNQVGQNVPQVSQGSQESEIDTLRKRYSDSSREAQRMRAQLNELKPYVPMLQAMKKDSGLTNHVRDYFDKGGAVPKNIKEKLKLDENFEFDMDDIVNNPGSDSAKVFNTMVDSVASKRVNETVAQQQQVQQQAQYKAGLQKNAAEFMQRNGLTPEEFKNFIRETQHKLQTKGMTFDDMYMIMNKGQVNKNVANATKTDMLNQMKNVRDIPVSQSGANSQSQSTTPDDGVFDVLKGLDGGIEDMFG